MKNSLDSAKHRRGSSPHREKEIGLIGHQIELSFADQQSESIAPQVGRQRGRYEKSNKQRAGASSDSQRY